MKQLLLSLLIAGFTSSISLASENHSSEEVSPRFGPGKAIEAFEAEQGFKLSGKSSLKMGVQFRRLEKSGPWQVPKTAIIHLKQSTGVYRKFEGWISFVLVKVEKSEGEFVKIKSDDLEPNDEIAVSGVTFLRMMDADLNSGTVDSCAH